MNVPSLVSSALALSLMLCSVLAAGDEPGDKASLTETNPLTGLGRNTLECFTGWNAALHLGAIAVTPAIVASGTDTDVHNYLARHQQLERASLPGVIAGYALPLAASGTLLGYGLSQGASREVAGGSAVLQSTAIAVTYQSVLKAFTGRPHPEGIVYEDDGASETFRFGFMRGGVHYGWPSGHMMTTTAIVTSLFPLYPNSWGLKLGGGAFLAYMAGSVAIHEKSSMHWFSDMVAGTLMGAAIGTSVGNGFAGHVGTGDETVSNMTVTPMMTPGSLGATVSGSF